MRQIRIGGFICKAKDMPSCMREFIKKVEKELKHYKKKSA
ncbi:hypothetical protein TXYLGN1_30000 [Tepidimicrobium xylanilyticum]|nr:hypothetical protein EN5CB1_10510 [Tepidimicrobium xylanilyticum]